MGKANAEKTAEVVSEGSYVCLAACLMYEAAISEHNLGVGTDSSLSFGTQAQSLDSCSHFAPSSAPCGLGLPPPSVCTGIKGGQTPD